MKKRLLELKKLVELSYAFGTNPPQKCIDEINYIEESLKQQMYEHEQRIQRIKDNIKKDSNVHPSIKPKDIPKVKDEVVEQIKEDFIGKPQTQKSSVEQVADFITKDVKEATIPTGEPVLAYQDGSLKTKIQRLEKWIERIGARGPGSGEVWFHKLDDVQFTNLSSGQTVIYDAGKKQWINISIGPNGNPIPSFDEVTTVGNTTNNSIAVSSITLKSITFSDSSIQTTAWAGYTSSIVSNGHSVYVDTTGQLILPLINLTSTSAGWITSTNWLNINAGGEVWSFTSDGSFITPYGLVINQQGLFFPDHTEQLTAYPGTSKIGRAHV